MSEPIEEFLGWLEREERELGFTTVEEGLTGIEEARIMLYEELGYDVTEKQYERLVEASIVRYEDLPAVGVTYSLRETKAGWYAQYRYLPTGKFISEEAAFGLLAFQKGL